MHLVGFQDLVFGARPSPTKNLNILHKESQHCALILICIDKHCHHVQCGPEQSGVAAGQQAYFETAGENWIPGKIFFR